MLISTAVNLSNYAFVWKYILPPFPIIVLSIAMLLTNDIERLFFNNRSILIYKASQYFSAGILGAGALTIELLILDHRDKKPYSINVYAFSFIFFFLILVSVIAFIFFIIHLIRIKKPKLSNYYIREDDLLNLNKSKNSVNASPISSLEYSKSNSFDSQHLFIEKAIFKGEHILVFREEKDKPRIYSFIAKEDLLKLKIYKRVNTNDKDKHEESS